MPKRNPLRVQEQKNALLRSRGQPAESDYGQALPELPDDTIAQFLKAHPNLAGYLPSAETIRSYLPGGAAPAQAYGSPVNETVVPKTSTGRQSNAGSLRDILRGALHIGSDVSPEADTALQDFVNSSEGRAIASELAVNPSPELVDRAKQSLIAMLSR
jgi:hypothetical protein